MSAAGPVRFDLECSVCHHRFTGYRTLKYLLVEYHETPDKTRTCKGSHRPPAGAPPLDIV